MKFHKNKLLTTGVAVALALAVGACSSSSDDDEMALMMNGDDDAMNGDADAMNGDADAMNGDADAMNGDGDAKTPAETLADARAALVALPDDATDEAKEMAQELVDVALRLPGNEAELITSLDAKVAQAEERQSTLDLNENERQTNAVTLQNAEDALASASAEAKEAAQAKVDEALQLPGNEAALIASLQGQITDQAQTVADATAKAAKDERIAREKAIKLAIELPGNRVGTAQKMLPDTPSGVTAVMATRNAAGMVTVDVNSDADDVYAGGETTAGDGDWNSVTMTKTDGNEATDTVVIYTDIDAPTDTLLTTVYLDGGTNLLDQALMFENMIDKRYGKAKSDGFPSGPTDTWTYGPDGRATTVIGTFDDVPGQFTCTISTCEVKTDPMGKLVTSMGWRFTATLQNSATVKVADTGYAYFGWWLNKPKLNTGMHDVEVFAGGTDAANVNAAIVGTATYAGPAAGKYVTKTSQAGAHSDSGVGHFTAKANLTAKFGLADGDVGTIGGLVTGFVLDDTTAASWTVTLEDATLNDTAIFDGTTEVDFGGGATATEGGGAGTWQGSFYDDADTDDPTNAPGTVAGTFDAITDNASVIGGFGATKQ